MGEFTERDNVGLFPHYQQQNEIKNSARYGPTEIRKSDCLEGERESTGNRDEGADMKRN